MSKVAVLLRVLPEGTEVNLDELEKRVRELAEVKDISREPIAFGLEALKVLALVPDAEGGSEELERRLSSLKGVSSVEVIGVTLV